MSEIQTSTWSELAASNNSSSPNGAPEGMPANGVNDTIREIMAALKRDWNRQHSTVLATGGTNSYSVSLSTNPTAWIQGLPVSFNAHLANTGAAQVYYGNLAVKTMKKASTSGLADLDSGDIQVNAHVKGEYNASADAVVIYAGLLTSQARQSGAFDVSGTLSVGGNINAGASLLVAGEADVSATLSAGHLIVTGAARFNGSASFSGTAVFATGIKFGDGSLQTTAAVGGKLLQHSSTANAAMATGTTTIPADDTIPQNTEGDQYMDITFTPTSASSVLEIDVQILVGSQSQALIVALFQDTTANAKMAVFEDPSTANPYARTIRFRFLDSAASTSARTYKVRAGLITAGTLTFNGQTGARLLGGVAYSFITVREFG